MDHAAAHPDDAAQSAARLRALWVAGAVVAALMSVAVALWARYGSAVFVDALGVVASCF